MYIESWLYIYIFLLLFDVWWSRFSFTMMLRFVVIENMQVPVIPHCKIKTKNGMMLPSAGQKGKMKSEWQEQLHSCSDIRCSSMLLTEEAYRYSLLCEQRSYPFKWKRREFKK